MIKVENIDVHGMKHAIKIAMRHPMCSYDKSDSIGIDYYEDGKYQFHMGNNDLDLAQRLYKSGTEHRTYARHIYVWMEIKAPLYWWKEMDRYTIGKAQVSESTMHKIHAKEFTLDDFSHEHLLDDVENEEEMVGYNGDEYIETAVGVLEWLVDGLNKFRGLFIKTKLKKYWWQLIQLLPSSYNQRRSICMSYEVIFKIIHERTGHKLDEWNEFVKILKDLPYIKEIMGLEE